MYGTTYYGGSGEACGGGCGTVYKMTLGKKNKYTQSVIYSFQGADKDGQTPYYGAGVTLDSKGNLYGTTYQGGSSENAGTVYELAVSGLSLIHIWRPRVETRSLASRGMTTVGRGLLPLKVAHYPTVTLLSLIHI